MLKNQQDIPNRRYDSHKLDLWPTILSLVYLCRNSRQVFHSTEVLDKSFTTDSCDCLFSDFGLVSYLYSKVSEAINWEITEHFSACLAFLQFTPVHYSLGLLRYT